MKATELLTYLTQCDPKEIGPELQKTLALSSLLNKKHNNANSEFFHASKEYTPRYHYDVKVTGRNKENRAREYVRIKIARTKSARHWNEMLIRFEHKTPGITFKSVVALHTKT